MRVPWKLLGGIAGWLAFAAATLQCILRTPHP